MTANATRPLLATRLSHSRVCSRGWSYLERSRRRDSRSADSQLERQPSPPEVSELHRGYPGESKAMGGGSSKPYASYVVPPSPDLVLKTLEKLPFMQMMDRKTIEELAVCFQVVRYARGAVIKTDQRQFYVVAEGAVDISSLIPTPNKRHNVTEVLCQRKVGDYISYAAREDMLARMMADVNPPDRESSKVERKKLIQMLELNRTTADAFVGCTLLKLHHARFQNLRAKYAVRKVESRNTARFSGGRHRPGSNSSLTRPEKMHLFASIIESDVASCLNDVPFLEIVEASRLLTLSNMCSYLFVRHGEKLCVEGEYGDRFFICVHGSLEVSVNVAVHAARAAFTAPASDSGEPTFVTSLQPPARTVKALKRLAAGAYFGEISLLLKIPRVCSVTALEDSLLIYIDRTSFCNFLKVVPEASAVLMEHVRFNFLDMLIKQGSALLNAIPPLKLEELSLISELVEFETNAPVIGLHDKHSAFFIVLTGSVELTYQVSDDSHPEIIHANPGGYFGQEAIMLSMPSPVSARCTKHCMLIKLNADTFMRFFGELPEVYSEFCIRCLQHEVNPEHVLQHYEANRLWSADCVGRRRYNEVALFEHIENYRWEADRTEDNMHGHSLVIFITFMSEGASMPVVLSIETVAAVEADIESSEVSFDTFAAAREEVLSNMDDEAFEAFKHSPTFTEFLASLHCPQTVTKSLTEEQRGMLNMSGKRGRGKLSVEDIDPMSTMPKRAFGTFSDKPSRSIAVAGGTNAGGNMLARLERKMTVRHNAIAEQAAEQRSRRKLRLDKSHRVMSKSFLF